MPTEGVRFRNGTYLGECLTDCNEEITLWPDRAIYSLTSKIADARRPDIHIEVPIQRSEWESLMRVRDDEALQSLPATIGAPDAADAGGEFLEVSENGTVTRIDFRLGATVPEISPLLEPLRRVRARLRRRYGR